MSFSDPTTDLLEFQRFLGQQISQGNTLSPEEALDLWRIENPVKDDLSDSTAAIREALAEMDAGDRGVSLDEFDREFRRRQGLPAP